MEKEIIWTETATNQLKDIYFYLLETSKSNTIVDKVIDTIINSVEILQKQWEIYELDEMKKGNSENFRAFEIYSYRISYKITEHFVYTLRVRHTSRNPKKF